MSNTEIQSQNKFCRTGSELRLHLSNVTASDTEDEIGAFDLK